ncbi:MAG: hypothetical protein ACXADY_16710 [Candidatus Hodarchaeales archaeon]|jgi:hypothetical protein
MLDFYYGVVLLFEVVLAVVIGIFIIRRDKSQLLNQVFLLVMFSFSGYLFFESIIYLLGVEDLSVVNLLRDFSVIFSTAAVVLLVFTALIVEKGDVIVQRKINLVIGFLSIAILVIIGAPLDSARIVENGVTYVIFEQADIIGKISLLFVPILFIFFSMIQYLRIRQSSEDQALRNKLLRLAIGLILITVGIGYFAVFPEFRYPGHISYIAGLVSLFWAFK